MFSAPGIRRQNHTSAYFCPAQPASLRCLQYYSGAYNVCQVERRYDFRTNCPLSVQSAQGQARSKGTSRHHQHPIIIKVKTVGWRTDARGLSASNDKTVPRYLSFRDPHPQTERGCGPRNPCRDRGPKTGFGGGVVLSQPCWLRLDSGLDPVSIRSPLYLFPNSYSARTLNRSPAKPWTQNLQMQRLAVASKPIVVSLRFGPAAGV